MSAEAAERETEDFVNKTKPKDQLVTKPSGVTCKSEIESDTDNLRPNNTSHLKTIKRDKDNFSFRTEENKH